MNIFEKLEQDITNQIESLQAKQQELIEKKKNLVVKREKIQNFLSSAQEMKQLLESEPELLKLVQKELGKIFVSHSSLQPKLPIKKDSNTTPNLESSGENHPPDATKVVQDEDIGEEESIKIFKFVDAQGKKTSF